jgi:hypothetical protein
VNKVVNKDLPCPVKKTIKGRVTANKDKRSLAGVIVTLKNECDGSTQTFVTGPDGRYQFEICEGCDYSIEASKENYGSKENKITTKNSKLPPVINSNVSMFEAGDVVNIDNIYYDYTKYNIEVWPLLFTLSLREESKMGCFGVTSATGASYIFLHNLPDRNKMLQNYRQNRDANWSEYIEKPITLYRSTIQQLNVTQTQIVSNIVTRKKEDCVFLYVHLFILLTLPDYENIHFYSRFKEKIFEFTTRVLGMSGMTYDEIKLSVILNETNPKQQSNI